MPFPVLGSYIQVAVSHNQQAATDVVPVGVREPVSRIVCVAYVVVIDVLVNFLVGDSELVRFNPVGPHSTITVREVPLPAVLDGRGQRVFRGGLVLADLVFQPGAFVVQVVLLFLGQVLVLHLFGGPFDAVQDAQVFVQFADNTHGSSSFFLAPGLSPGS